MRITVLELPAVWGDPVSSLARVDEVLRGGPSTDLVLLPEQSLSGYVSPERDFDVTRFAEPLDGPTAAGSAAIAKKFGIHLVAPLVLAEGKCVYNAMVAYGPGGEVVFVYRKRHPWTPETWATPGPDDAPVVSIAGLRVTIAVCFDLHFLAEAEKDPEIPEEERDERKLEADLLLFPSAWVERPDRRRERLARLARTAHIWIANANWGEGVVRVPGQGRSCIISPAGAIREARSGRVDQAISG